LRLNLGHLNFSAERIKGTLAQDTRPRLMVIMAHPDDAEFICAGTVAKYIEDGYRVQYVLATSGNKGSDDPHITPADLAAIREAEQEAAARVLGVEEVTFLRHNDGELEVTLAFRKELALVLRRGRPDVVFTFDPWMHYQIHPDHRAVGQTALDAIAAARDHLYYPEQLTEGLREHRVHQVYLFATEHPNYWVDITGTIEKKIAALLCHKSQIGQRDIATLIKERARAVGAEHGYPYAEAFKHLYLR
jgi:LmbE family N-acetylglucosaminyl deacetylase